MHGAALEGTEWQDGKEQCQFVPSKARLGSQVQGFYVRSETSALHWGEAIIRQQDWGYNTELILGRQPGLSPVSKEIPNAQLATVWLFASKE